MQYFVKPDSIVRKIWGKSDTILFIFAGASAEFAVNKAVDWLYFTGKLPSDPLGRLFSTVTYARQIVFSEQKEAYKAIDKIAAIHQGVESKRGARIPDWAYRDVLFMLIDYSIRSFELLERKLTNAEREETFDVFNRVGTRMGIPGLPANYVEWKAMRRTHIHENLISSTFTIDLFAQYKKHLGQVRFILLQQAQMLVLPEEVNKLLQPNQFTIFPVVVFFYKITRSISLDKLLKNLILPKEYKSQIDAMDVAA